MEMEVMAAGMMGHYEKTEISMNVQCVFGVYKCE